MLFLGNSIRFKFVLIMSVCIIMASKSVSALNEPVLGLPPIEPGLETPQVENQIQEFLKQLDESEPALTIGEAEEYVKELLPIVEDLSGRKFKSPPLVRIVPRDELSDVIYNDLIFESANLSASADLDYIAYLYSLSFLGYYSFQEKTLYIQPKVITANIVLYKIDWINGKDLAKWIILHELVHALQDQQCDFSNNIKNIKSIEELLTFVALIEGHAVFIGEQFLKELKSEPDIIDKYISLFATHAEYGDFNIKFVQYTEGENFIKYIFNRGGNEEIWRVLLDMPANSTMIFHPETYFQPDPDMNIDYAKILDGIEEYFPQCEVPNINKWDTINKEIGPLSLYGYSQFDMNTKNEILMNIKKGNVLRGACPILALPNAYFTVTLLTMYENDFLARFANASEEKIMNNSQMMGIVFSAENLSNMINNGYRIARKIKMTRKETMYQDLVYIIAKKNYYIEIMISGFNIQDEKIEEIVNEIWRRYSKLRHEKDH